LETWFGFFIALGMVLFFFVVQRIYVILSAKKQQKIAISILFAGIGMVLLMLFIIIGFIVVNGIPAISYNFLTEAPTYSGRSGGILPAIFGTIYLVIGAILFAFPLGLGAGIFLAEYSKETKFTRIVRIAIDNLNGTPSIVFGLFGFTVFVLYFHMGITLLGGQLTLGLMVLPTIIRTTEQSIKTVPQELRDGSYALGATKWQTVRKVVLPSASPGIITGIILSMGRAAGETAPIMFTACVFLSSVLPTSELQPVMALSFNIFMLATSVPGGRTNAFGTALILLIIVLILYAIAMRYRAKIKNSVSKSFLY
jgi:phosphate transport system permease protein